MLFVLASPSDNFISPLLFLDEMKIYQQAQQEYKNALKQKAKRQIVAIKPDATDEQGMSITLCPCMGSHC